MNNLNNIFVPLKHFLPEPASLNAKFSYEFFLLNLIIYFLVFFIVIFLFVYFSYKYKSSDVIENKIIISIHSKKGFFFEYISMFIFFIFVISLNLISFKIYFNYKINSEYNEIKVVGQKWLWNFNYLRDKISISGNNIEVAVKLGENIKLTMTAQDVIHSLWLPNFYIKQDLIPGRYTVLNISPNLIGKYPIFCAEFCGEKHSDMIAVLNVMSEKDYNKWIENIKNNSNDKTLLEIGAETYNNKGCNSCHSLDSSVKVGPGFGKLYEKIENLESGEKVLVDDGYIRQSILEPQKQITKGFPPIMPSFQGQISEREILGLIELIKSLK